MIENEETAIDLKKVDVKIIEFDKLLSTITDVDDRVKTLWIDVYRNATLDRMSAESLYTKLFILSHSNDNTHVECAPLITKYLERMHKSNEQLLQLADQVIAATKVETGNTAEDIYEQIGN